MHSNILDDRQRYTSQDDIGLQRLQIILKNAFKNFKLPLDFLNSLARHFSCGVSDLCDLIQLRSNHSEGPCNVTKLGEVVSFYLSLNSHAPYIYGNSQIQLVRFFLYDLIFIAVHTDKQLSISLIYIYHPFYAI